MDIRGDSFVYGNILLRQRLSNVVRRLRLCVGATEYNLVARIFDHIDSRMDGGNIFADSTLRKIRSGNNAKLIANSLIGIVAIICALAGMFLLNIVLGDNIEFYFGAEYNVACFVLFFLSAIISVGLLYLSIFWKGEHDKKYKLYILIGIAIVVAIALMIFVPNLIATIKRGG